MVMRSPLHGWGGRRGGRGGGGGEFASNLGGFPEVLAKYGLQATTAGKVVVRFVFVACLVGLGKGILWALLFWVCPQAPVSR